MIGIYTPEILGEPWGNNPASADTLVIILSFVLILMFGLFLLSFKMRLQIEIKDSGLRYRFPLLAGKWKMISKEEIESFKLRTCHPVVEYGGWGLKGGTRKRAYNVSGNIGLELILKNDRKVLFGMQKSQAIKYAIEKMMYGERLKKDD